MKKLNKEQFSAIQNLFSQTIKEEVKENNLLIKDVMDLNKVANTYFWNMDRDSTERHEFNLAHDKAIETLKNLGVEEFHEVTRVGGDYESEAGQIIFQADGYEDLLSIEFIHYSYGETEITEPIELVEKVAKIIYVYNKTSIND